MFNATLRFTSGLFLLGSVLGVQAQLTDDFEDGDFTTGTTWSGSGALFTVVDDGGDQRLRSNSPIAATYYLTTPNTLVNDAQWEFFIDLRFATSGVNYVDVFLMSDAPNLTTGANGYFVRMGGTADRLELFRSDAGTAVSLAVQSPDGAVNSSTSNPFRIKATRSAAGIWTLLFDDGALGTYTTAGSATDATYTTATHFGLRVEQSSAASVVNNHFFDDLLVDAIPVDNTPPTITSVTAISATQVDVQFSEALDPATAETEANYEIQPLIGVSLAALDGVNPSLVHLTPTPALTSGTTYGLLVSAVEDLAANAMPVGPPIDFTYVVPDVADYRDVVINEFMADQTPVVGLPEAEFVELHNATTDKVFDLSGWTFSDGTSTATLPTYALTPGSYVVVVGAASAPLFASVPNLISVSTLPSLNNDGDQLTLKDITAVTIDALTYDLTWYQDAVKEDGGWTLEQIDPTSPCSGANNWRASNAAAGGTPGTQNSVYAIVPDLQAPSLTSVQVNDPTTLILVFNEAMDVVSLATGTYSISPTIGVSIAVPVGTSGVQLTLSSPLVVGTMYTITVTGVNDCPGNAIGSANTATFALPEPVEVGDVVINEVLYDPVGSGSDFVELYNRSNKVLSLAGWELASVSDGAVGSALTITSSAFLLLPGAYALITEDANNIATLYPQSHTDRFIVTDMPSYNNGEGSVVLQAPDGMQLDRVDYNDDLHFTLVNNPEGYSLERVDPFRPSSDNTNWQTASDVAGRATPGFLNSQYAPAPAASGEMTLDTEIFSPDNDGFQDVLTIAYRFDQPGFVGTLSIFDVAGREARKLMDSQLLGTEGSISWDGVLEGGDLGRIGPYIVLLEVFDLAGNTERFKKTVTLAHKLD
ncbi:MAG: lamin tail domain-containing protein [Flavobacteriales bacterium]